ncbi:MAG: Holliday junction branch migration protein RuvA [Planctomycetota bacterium]
MIARMYGRLEECSEGLAVVYTGNGLWYELLVPSCDVERLGRQRGAEVTLHTIHYLEGDPSHGVQTPRLIGFLTEEDREFFRIYTTVKGIGVRKALRSLARPIAEVAGAIQNKDTKLLKALPEIGARTADRIVAELHGKLDGYAATAPPAEADETTEAAQDAIAVLVQLGERQADAAALVQRVLAVSPELDSSEEILQHVYRLRSAK